MTSSAVPKINVICLKDLQLFHTIVYTFYIGISVFFFRSVLPPPRRASGPLSFVVVNLSLCRRGFTSRSTFETSTFLRFRAHVYVTCSVRRSLPVNTNKKNTIQCVGKVPRNRHSAREYAAARNSTKFYNASYLLRTLIIRFFFGFSLPVFPSTLLTIFRFSPSA